MKAIVECREHTVTGKIGIVLAVVGMVVLGQIPWVLMFGLGLLIGDMLDISMEKEEDEE